ncbi:hypothetical protein EIF87_24020, partial [Escherichia coli H6]|nr:hypothetical protein [Escherichia coli H6]
STKSLMIRKKELEDKISTLNNRINELFNMPLNLDDYCSYIPSYVENCGKPYIDISGDNKTTWGDCEKENGEIGAKIKYKRLVENATSAFNDSFYMMCFYHPVVITELLTKILKEKYKDIWGNNELPTIAERRLEVDKLIAEREEIQKELTEIEACVNNIKGNLIDIEIKETP